MAQVWITNSSTNVEAMVNSVNAACNLEFIPDQVHLLENPGVEDAVSEALDHMQAIIEAYGTEQPEFNVASLEEEVAFEQIHAYHKGTIETAREQGDDVAIDITPGRKFMSAIAFAACMRYDADHVFYFYLSSPELRAALSGYSTHGS